jgi:cell fate (sporulation/competence/biofilm development) regulator YlbF (YheA/YmcA/DUF963 family)
MPLRAKQEAAVDKGMEITSAQNTLSTTLLEATSVLAGNLAQSEPFLRLQEADLQLHADQEAMRLLKDFTELQQKIRTQQHSSSISESDIKRLRELQNSIGANSMIQEHSLAQETASAFLREVNQEISNLLGVDFASLTRRTSGCC